MTSTERRRAPRRTPQDNEGLSRVRLRTGPELLVVDVSIWGVLVEGTVRLLPGTRLDVHVVTKTGRVLIRSRVVRARVCAVTAGEIRYRGALVFEHTIDTSAAATT